MKSTLKKILSASLMLMCSLAMQSCGAQDEKEARPSEVIAHGYNGVLFDLESSLKKAGYLEVAGWMVKNGDIDHPWETSSSISAAEWCLVETNKQKAVFRHCVYGVQSVLERDQKGKPTFRTEDAIEFLLPAGLEIFGDDTNCSSKSHPYRTVVAVGRWKNRSKPKIGGYAHLIRQAWIVEPLTRKFVAISPKEVSCEINEDRD